MPKPHPKEFRDDVVRVAHQHQRGVTLMQVAKDFGISESCLRNWVAHADRDAGLRPEQDRAESHERRGGQAATWSTNSTSSATTSSVAREPIATRSDTRLPRMVGRPSPGTPARPGATWRAAGAGAGQGWRRRER
ncbi:transposase [Nostocoides japonicum]